jgi:hypothetical protein
MGRKCRMAVRLAMGLAAVAGALGGEGAGGEEFHYDLRRGVADQPVLVPTVSARRRSTLGISRESAGAWAKPRNG